MSMFVSELIAAHDGWLSMRRSEGTRIKYGQHLKAFQEWAGNRPIESITAQEIEFEFLGPWAQTVSAATLRNRIAALRSLFEFCERFEYIDRNPMRRIESPPRDEKMGNWLRPEDDLALQEAAATPIERIVVMLLRYTGLRVSEACSLRWTDVNLEASPPTLTVRTSKTNAGKRTIPVPAVLVPSLRSWRHYLECRDVYTTDGLVLTTRNRTPMWPQFVWRIVVRVGERAGIGHITPHGLRRTYGSALINNGCRLEAVSKALGHANTTVTERSYAALTDERIASEVLEAMGGDDTT
jgi:integrase